jgi:hypothetical protein
MLDKTAKDLIKTESKQEKINYILNCRLDYFFIVDSAYKNAYKILSDFYQSLNEDQINTEFGFYLDDDIQGSIVRYKRPKKGVNKWI